MKIKKLLFALLFASQALGKGGIFVGYDMEFGILNIDHRQTITNLFGTATLPLSTHNERGIHPSVGYGMGYEYYFEDKPNMGVRISARVNAGHANMQLTTIDNSTPPEIYDLVFEFFTLKGGVGAEFIWDFWRAGDLALGLSSGLMLELGYFGSTATTINNQYGIDRPSFSTIGFTPTIGLYMDFLPFYISLSYRLFSIPLLSTYDFKPILRTDEMAYYVENRLNFSSYFALQLGYKF